MAYTEKYVTTTGAGAHDGTSLANAWSLTEAVSNAAAGNSVNIEEGTYTLAANLVFPNGSNESPIRYRGMTSGGTAGDLEDVGRATATAALTVTNFPKIDGGASYSITWGTFNQHQHIHFTSSRLASTVVCKAQSGAWRCLFENTVGSGTFWGGLAMIAGDYYGYFSDCDYTSNTTGGINLVSASRGRFHNCRFWLTAGSPSSSSYGNALSINSSITNSLLFNFGIGIRLNHGVSCVNNTIYDCDTGVMLQTSHAVNVENCIIYNMSGYGIAGTTWTNPLLWNNAMGALTSGRLYTSGGGTTIEEIHPVTLASDPFTNAAGEDFTLNDVKNGGRLCRGGSRYFGGHGDLGAVPHQVRTRSVFV